MDKTQLLDEVLMKTNLKKLESIKDLYASLEEKEKIFCEHFCIHCAKGCGKCCEVFVPDITELEADFLAYGLIKENKADLVLKQLENIKSDIISCPLYRSDSDFHCSVYAWRPLICRLFGASASKNKNGNPIFRDCKYNKLSSNVSSEKLKKDAEYVVTMSDYGILLEDEEAGNNNKEPLPIALKKAINKIEYLLYLASISEK